MAANSFVLQKMTCHYLNWQNLNSWSLRYCSLNCWHFNCRNLKFPTPPWPYKPFLLNIYKLFLTTCFIIFRLGLMWKFLFISKSLWSNLIIQCLQNNSNFPLQMYVKNELSSMLSGKIEYQKECCISKETLHTVTGCSMMSGFKKVFHAFSSVFAVDDIVSSYYVIDF